jgi:hypothetical protein
LLDWVQSRNSYSTLTLFQPLGESIVNDSIHISNFNPSNSEPDVLWKYVQSMNPETVAQLSRPESQEVLQVMERNITGLLGGLPNEGFDVTIATSREHLGRLVASAMMSGYFLRNAEQRLALEATFGDALESSLDNLTSEA